MSISTSATAMTPKRAAGRDHDRRCREIVKAGKVRWIGFSEWSPEQIQAAHDHARGGEVRLQPAAIFAALSPARGQTVIPICAPRPASPKLSGRRLAQGVLTGKYDPNSPPPARHPRHLRRDEQRFIARLDGKAGAGGRAEALKPIAAEAGLTLGQFALAWVLREPNVASAIVGASRPEQLDENCRRLRCERSIRPYSPRPRRSWRRPFRSSA